MEIYLYFAPMHMALYMYDVTFVFTSEHMKLYL